MESLFVGRFFFGGHQNVPLPAPRTEQEKHWGSPPPPCFAAALRARHPRADRSPEFVQKLCQGRIALLPSEAPPIVGGEGGKNTRKTMAACPHFFGPREEEPRGLLQRNVNGKKAPQGPVKPRGLSADLWRLGGEGKSAFSLFPSSDFHTVSFFFAPGLVWFGLINQSIAVTFIGCATEKELLSQTLGHLRPSPVPSPVT